jgi:choline dehydrogenase
MPLINPRYFSDPYDIATLVKGTQMALDILEAPAFAPYRGKMVHPYDRNDPKQIEDQLRNLSDTEYHPCGTCRMGPDTDPKAVVDAQLRVKGIDGLRVADASIFPRITTNNTQAPTVMVGEKCADMMRAAAGDH